MQQPLNNADIDHRLKPLDHWSLDANKTSIFKSVVFDSFKTAVKFFVHVAEVAERLDHHPEVLSSYTHMRIQLTTHDAGGLTHKDFELAKHIDQLLADVLPRPSQTSATRP